jgi:hypothetical protein
LPLKHRLFAQKLQETIHFELPMLHFSFSEIAFSGGNLGNKGDVKFTTSSNWWLITLGAWRHGRCPKDPSAHGNINLKLLLMIFPVEFYQLLKT